MTDNQTTDSTWSDELAERIESIIEDWISTVGEPRGGYDIGSREEGPFTSSRDGAVYFRRRLYDPSDRGNTPATLTIFFGGLGGMVLNVHDWRYPDDDLTATVKRLPMFEAMPIRLKQEFLRKTKPQQMNLQAFNKVVAKASAELQEKRRAAADEATRIYSMAARDEMKVATHAYTIKKHIKVPQLVRWLPNGPDPSKSGPVLVVPVVDPLTDEIITLQRVYEDGEKRFMNARGATPLFRGGYFPVKISDKATVILCEGIATGCSLAEICSSDDTVLSCFDCHNMERTAKTILKSKKWQEVKRLIIACDLDKNFAGQKAAIAIEDYAASIGQAERVLIVPPIRMNGGGTDWNDKVVEQGIATASEEFITMELWADKGFSQKFKEQMKEAEAHEHL